MLLTPCKAGQYHDIIWIIEEVIPHFPHFALDWSEVCPPPHAWPRLSFVQRPHMCRHRQHLQHQTVEVLHKELPPTERTNETNLNPCLRSMTNRDNLGTCTMSIKARTETEIELCNLPLVCELGGAAPSHGMFEDITGPRSCDNIFTSSGMKVCK